ncbi:MAG TPA: hypothetical protein VFI11_05715 [Anaerolineales bacterium]|nr:hypothetical protein [Anaerolineales bacterium]
MHPKKIAIGGLTVIPLVALALTLAPLTAFAQSVTVDGVTLTTPDDQLACPPNGEVVIGGVAADVNITYDFFDVTDPTYVHLGGQTVVSTGADLVLAFPYPAEVEDKSFAVFVSTIGTSLERAVLGSSWLVNCEEPTETPTQTPTETVTPTDTPTVMPSETPTATPVVLQGCGPGYWKQEHHFDSWVGYAPTDDYEVVFAVDASFDPSTLLDAAWLRGGGEFALARQAVAALLNSANPDVDYAYTTAEVIAMVQDAYATGDFESVKDTLEGANESGCPLN